MAETIKIDKLFEMLSGKKRQMDVIVKQMDGMKGQIEVMNGKLAQISKDTDLKIHNLTTKVHKENADSYCSCK